MNDKKKEKLKKDLVKGGFMREDDTLIEYVQANYRKRLLGKMAKWRQGWAYFTEERFICLPFGITVKNVVIPYKSIREIGTCSQGFFPMGITITYEKPETGELIKESFSISKRKKWIEFLKEKAGI